MEKKKRRIGFFTKLAVVVFTVWAAITLINLQFQTNERQSEATQLNQLLEETNAENTALRAALGSELSDEAIAAQARSKLDMALPGERVFVDTSN